MRRIGSRSPQEPVRRLLGGLALLLLALPAGAVQHEVRILLDLDNDAATGCLVNTADGPLDGVEQILTSTVETTASPEAGTVTDVALSDCLDPLTGTFSGSTSFGGGWPVGIGNGVGGRDVVETSVPLASLVVPDPSVVRLGVVVTDEFGGEEALLTVGDMPDGAPILLNLQSLLEIPTLGEWGLLLLATLLAAASLALLRRGGTAIVGLVLLFLAVGVARGAGSLDGLTGDWFAADQLASDGLVLFGKEAGGELCFRVDVDLIFNQAPTITAIADQTIPEDGTTGPLAFTVGDAESPAGSLTVTASSSNQILVPDGNLTLGGAGANRTITVTPAANQNGMTDVTVTVEDPDGGSASTTFRVTVTSDNDPPTITAIADQTIDEDTSTGPLPFTVGDPETAPGSLTVTASSNDQTIIPDGNLVLGGSGANRTITVTPAADQNGGPVTVTVTVMDGDGGSVAEPFDVTVNPVNDPPTISAIADQTIDEDTSTGPLAFTIDDVDDPVGSLTVGAASSDQTLIPDGNLTLGGTAPNLTIEATPAANENGGPVTVMVTVTDPSSAAASEPFDVTVNPVNDPPATVGETFDVAAGNFDPAIGNTTLQFANTDTATEPHVFVMGDVLDNDSDIENDPLGVSAVDGDAGAVGSAKTLPSGAVVTLEADGEFTYSPPLGFEGNDSFTYTVFDGADSVMATVNVEIAGMVWYLDNDPANDGTGDDGRAASPFDTIAQFDAENGMGAGDDPEAGDTIFLFEGTSTYDAADTDGLDLLDGQKLLGEGVALVVGSTTLVPAGNRPAIDNPTSGGDAVTVLADATEGDKTGIEIRGLQISGDDNAVEVTSAGAAQMGVLLSDNLFADSGGAALDANPGSSGAFDLAVENNTYSTSSPTGNGIDVTTAPGNSAAVTVAINGNTDITSSSGTGIQLDGTLGTGTLFVTAFADNTIHGNTAGTGMMATGITFDADPSDSDFDQVAAGTWSVGSSTNPVGTTGVFLETVDGNLSFTQLDVFAGGGASLEVAGAGQFTGTSGFQLVVATGTINATGGPAVAIDPATVNATFASLTSNDSLTTGISLTDVAGSFTASTVAIDDTAGAGVSILNSSANVALDGGFIGETASTATTTGGNAVDVDGSSGNVTVAPTLTNTTGRSVEVTNHTGGATITFSGAIDDDGTGVLLNANGASGGATVNFTGGLDLATTTNDAFTATGGGTVNVADGVVTNTVTTTTGTGVNIANTTIGATGVTFDSVSTSGAASGILLASTGSGDFAANGGSISNASSRGVDLDSVSGDFTYAGSISTTAAGRSVEVTNHSGGAQAGGTAVSFSGAIDDNGLGVHLDNNDAGTGATVGFSGGLDLDTGTNTAFNATNGGTVEVLDGTVTNDIDTTTGVGVNITNTTIGASGVTFDSVSVNGAANGIVLDTTGTSGGFNVTGDGSTAGSGGTIQNTTSDGVLLTTTQDVAFDFMNITGSGANGIRGSNVTDFSLNGSTVESNGDAVNEGGLRFDQNLLGTAAISSSTIRASAEHNIEIINTSSTALTLTVTGTTISDTDLSGLGADGLLLETRSSASASVTVTDSTFSDNASDGIQVSAIDGSTASLTVEESAGTSSFSNGARGLNLSAATNADLSFSVTDTDFDNFSPSLGEEAINLALVSTSTASSSLTGTIDNNVFSNSGGGVGVDLRGDGVATLDISNNTMTSSINREVIDIITGDAAGDAAAFNLTALNNSLTSQNRDALFVEALRATSLCLNIRGNSATPGAGDDAYVIFDSTTGAAQLESGSTDCGGAACTDAEDHITSNNAGTPVTIDPLTLIAPGTCSTP